MISKTVQLTISSQLEVEILLFALDRYIQDLGITIDRFDDDLSYMFVSRLEETTNVRDRLLRTLDGDSRYVIRPEGTLPGIAT